MKVWKKLSAVALALMLVTVLTVMASATTHDNVLTNGGVESNSDKSSVGTTINIPKAITVHGTPDSVYSPIVNYAYAIAPATVASGTIVTDSTNGVGAVKTGPADGVSLTDNIAAFTSELTNLSDGTATVFDTITVSVVLNAFNNETYGPGIYRYAITSDNTAAVYNAGVTPSGAANRDDRFLDVYIKNGETSGTIEVYGFVLLTANQSVTSSDNPSVKSNGFETDDYYTIDVQLKKVITGNAANKTHQFPFSITVSNNSLSYSYAKGDATLANDGSISALSTMLADTEVFHIKGLNPKATVTYVETNDTPDTYKVTIKDYADAVINNVNETATNKDGTQTTDELTVTTYDTDNSTSAVVTTTPTASNNADITFINNLEAISPTGVALRYAPYLAMLGAGVVALPLTLRKREEEI